MIPFTIIAPIMPFKKSASDALAAIGLKMKAKLDKIIILRLKFFIFVKIFINFPF
jgi:hypothetical protein